MKGSAAVLSALLLLALCSSAVAQLDGLPTTCCFSYTPRPIPRNLIASAFLTSSKCRLPGVILVTKKGREVCANPEEPWVQKRLELFQNQEN
ncbi:C-C motif chemokine 4-like [Coturnix japonica]|uniref:C-C motif chemokine 4-like n=1 Tax=Coturnix japonica TaxID=93934 RepID=UPI000776C6F3|nr:C-C motif chemokine 4-like [Coturnix japonica]